MSRLRRNWAADAKWWARRRSAARRIRSSKCSCDRAVANPWKTLEAIAEADLITLGPGSLFTSVIPNLLVDGIAEAIASSGAPKVYVCNLMEEPGETDGYKASDHLKALLRHSKDGLADYVIVNERPAAEPVLRRYAATEAGPVEVDRAALEAMGVEVLSVDLLAGGDIVRHDSAILASLLVDLASRSR